MKIVLRNIIKLSSIVFISLIVVVFASTEISNASKYITKKSKTSEKRYLSEHQCFFNGKIRGKKFK